MSTYTETVDRFVVEYRETNLTAQELAQISINGLDPHELWVLRWSYDSAAAAEASAAADQRWHLEFCATYGYAPWKIYRWRDLGASVTRERQAWFI